MMKININHGCHVCTSDMDIDVAADVASDMDNYDDVAADVAGTNDMVDYVAGIDDMDIDIAAGVALVAYLLIGPF
jgi:hypothetical protein